MVEIPVQTALISEDDLMRLGSDTRVEIVDGELVYISPVGGMHVFVVNNTYDALKPIVKEKKLGYLFTDGLIYRMFGTSEDIRGARVPDVSFIRKANIPKDWDLRRPFLGVPDLAIEVISPGDDAVDVLKKVREYFSKGTEQVWRMYPDEKEVHQYFRDDPDAVRVYTGDKLIDADAFSPGLILVMSDLFLLPDLD
ncbi:MAG: Uma2 family endonuclease [Chloroflexota bacterium]